MPQRALVLFLVIASAAPPLGAQSLVAITFEQCLRAVDASPRVRSGAAAATHLARATATLPTLDANPQLSVALGPRVAPSHEVGPEVQVSLSHSISLTGAVPSRRDAMRAETAQYSGEADLTTLSLRRAAALRWITLWAVQRDVDALRDDLVAACASADGLRRLASLGERTEGDAVQGEAECALARFRESEARGALTEAQLLLAGELGYMDTALRAEGAPPVARPPVVSEARALAALDEMPEVRVHTLAAETARRRAEEERATRGTRLTLGAMLQRDAVGATVAFATLSLPIPMADLSARERAPLTAAALTEAGRAGERRRQAAGAIRVAFHDIEHEAELERQLREGVLPGVTALLARRTREAAAGEATALEVLDARRQLVAARRRLIEAQAALARANVHIGLTLGAIGVRG